MAMTSESDMRAAGTFAAEDFAAAGLRAFAAEGGDAFFTGFLIGLLIGFFIGR
jgi:hypothetical protein